MSEFLRRFEFGSRPHGPGMNVHLQLGESFGREAAAAWYAAAERFGVEALVPQMKGRSEVCPGLGYDCLVRGADELHAQRLDVAERWFQLSAALSEVTSAWEIAFTAQLGLDRVRFDRGEREDVLRVVAGRAVAALNLFTAGLYRITSWCHAQLLGRYYEDVTELNREQTHSLLLALDPAVAVGLEGHISLSDPAIYAGARELYNKALDLAGQLLTTERLGHPRLDDVLFASGLGNAVLEDAVRVSARLRYLGSHELADRVRTFWRERQA